MKRNWKPMSDSEFTQYGKDHGLYGLGPREAVKKDSGYYQEANRRGLVDDVFRRRITRSDPIKWRDMTKEDIIQYGKDHKYFGLTPTEIIGLKGEGRNYYEAVLRCGLADVVFRRERRIYVRWSTMTNEEIIQYGKDHDLHGLSPSEVQNKDLTYYNEIRKRGLKDHVFNRKIRNFKEAEIVQFLEENEAAMGIASLSAVNGYLHEAVRLLIQEWSDRFPDYDRLVKMLPRLIPRITHALIPISVAEGDGEMNDLFSPNVSVDTRRDLADLLYRIGVEEYQHTEYRAWKDERRRENLQPDSAFVRNCRAYQTGERPLYVPMSSQDGDDSEGSKDSAPERPLTSTDVRYRTWVEKHALKESDGQHMAERIVNRWTSHPTIHFVTVVQQGQESLLAETLDCLEGQFYKGWGLTIIASTPSPDPLFDQMEMLEWIHVEDDFAAVLGRVLDESQADWVALIEAGDRFEPHLLFSCVDYTNLHPQWRLIYTDEDSIDGDGNRFDAKFKPDFNLDLLRSTPYMGSFCLYKGGGFRRLIVFSRGCTFKSPN